MVVVIRYARALAIYTVSKTAMVVGIKVVWLNICSYYEKGSVTGQIGVDTTN